MWWPGGLVSTLLVFRNNLSHARYNEARLLIGQTKNALRTFYQQVHVCMPEVMIAVLKNPESDEVNEYREKSLDVMKMAEVCGPAAASR